MKRFCVGFVASFFLGMIVHASEKDVEKCIEMILSAPDAPIEPKRPDTGVDPDDPVFKRLQEGDVDFVQQAIRSGPTRRSIAAIMLLSAMKFEKARALVPKLLDSDISDNLKLIVLCEWDHSDPHFVPYLMRATQSRSIDLREGAMSLLSGMMDPRGFSFFGKMVAEKSEIADQASWALNRFLRVSKGIPGEPRELELQRWQTWWGKYGKRYENITSSDKVEFARLLLTDPNEEVRRKAVETLDEWAAPALAERLLNDELPDIRAAILARLVASQNSCGIPVYGKLVSVENGTGPTASDYALALSTCFFSPRLKKGASEAENVTFWRSWVSVRSSTPSNSMHNP